MSRLPVSEPSAVVEEGKGGKRRVVSFSPQTKKALYRWLEDRSAEPNSPLFLSRRGGLAEEALTRRGLLKLFERLGATAGIRRDRCSPHTMRHAFAVSFLRAGGNLFTLQCLLGHETLALAKRRPKRYCARCQGFGCTIFGSNGFPDLSTPKTMWTSLRITRASTGTRHPPPSSSTCRRLGVALP